MRPYRRLDDRLDDVAFLEQQGYTREEIARRLGYKSRDAIDQALRRARNRTLGGTRGAA